MEIRSATIAYSKSKSKRVKNRKQDILWKLDQLDSTICNNNNIIINFIYIASISLIVLGDLQCQEKCNKNIKT